MSTGTGLRALVRRFREDAEKLREYRDERMALICEQHAEAVLRAIEQEEDQLLNLQEAAAVSGYDADHLGRLVREGAIPNAGRKFAPAIRRGDLPVKPGVATERPEMQLLGQDWDQIARAVVHSHTEESDG